MVPYRLNREKSETRGRMEGITLEGCWKVKGGGRHEEWFDREMEVWQRR